MNLLRKTIVQGAAAPTKLDAPTLEAAITQGTEVLRVVVPANADYVLLDYWSSATGVQTFMWITVTQDLPSVAGSAAFSALAVAEGYLTSDATAITTPSSQCNPPTMTNYGDGTFTMDRAGVTGGTLYYSIDAGAWTLYPETGVYVGGGHTVYGIHVKFADNWNSDAASVSVTES